MPKQISAIRLQDFTTRSHFSIHHQHNESKFRVRFPSQHQTRLNLGSIPEFNNKYGFDSRIYNKRISKYKKKLKFERAVIFILFLFQVTRGTIFPTKTFVHFNVQHFLNAQIYKKALKGLEKKYLEYFFWFFFFLTSATTVADLPVRRLPVRRSNDDVDVEMMEMK